MDLQIVVMECPYLMMDRSEVRDLFTKTIEMKRLGYAKEYPYNVMPVGTTDFIGTHVIFCEKRGTELDPIMAYKVVTNHQCKEFNLSYPALDLVKSSHAPKHVAAVEEILDRCERENRTLYYYSSWTMHPRIRQTKDIVQELHQLFRALGPLFQSSQNSQSIAGGNVRFRTERIYYFLGYEELKYQNEVLPPIEAAFAYGEKVAIFYQHDSFSKEACALAEQYRSLWEQRLQWVPERPGHAEKIAA